MKFSSAALCSVLLSAVATTAFVPASLQRSTAVATPFGVKNLAVGTGTSLQMSTETSGAETYEFTSDVGRVMDLIINSLYSDRDIFLRELVSNAADACDKKRFLSLTSEDKMANPEIKIKCNPDANTVTIQDTGVGMTKDELINNLGKIAQSGTRAFVQALGEGTADVNLIGQFGVGFYSAYLVAEEVTVVTKSMQEGSKAYKWVSQADSSYTIEELEDDGGLESSTGTMLTLKLKDDAVEYLEASKLEELLQRYSEFIEFPISVWKEKTEYKTVPDEEANKDLKEGEEPKTKTVPEIVEGYELINSQKPIWTRAPKDVTDEEYKQFYKTAFRNANDDPMSHSHFVLEGQVECKAILYIPGFLPFELSKDMFDENARNMRLYVKRVFINDQFEGLMPRWLKFIRGVVDSDDLPLNVSREILQRSKVLSIINKRLVRKSLDMIREIASENPERYVMFWNNFGKYLKVGIVEDERNRKEVAPLLRFYSSNSGDEYTSLEKYVESMPEGQKAIYYVTGDGRERTAMSPAIEKLSSRGYEVLFCTEPLDEIMMESLKEFKEFDLVDAGKENLKLEGNENSEEAKKKKEDLNRQYIDIVSYLEVLLKGKVEKVSVSDLLTGSPAALVQGAYGMSPTMQRYMRAQAVSSGQDMEGLMGARDKAVLEINPKHPIVKDLEKMIKTDKESKKTEDFALLMYDIASMTSGYDVNDASSFAKRVMGLMSDGPVPEAEVVAEAEVVPEKKKSDETEGSDGGSEEVKAAEVEVLP